ncbi:M16 family metallopeptidase [Portibacter lacus]|uniref:Peptidase M16 n=1 Tax=Portibacter lacus TaxID=1099794 RepID=A0AA37WFZ9_9BACT|nr:pitrilysin family protein [Portibacter lacus]GLR19258.1 peptidase M16 [Portibacter lacus]
MISYERRVLSNGLRVIVHEDKSTPLVAINILYNVGSKNEEPNKTGFAHLFEHLMFSGSENVSDFDDPIQKAGGESNAFTNNDITNFYEILPAENFETALWLESDRMRSLVCGKKEFEIQQKVVIEEFKETTLNQPYGQVWHDVSAAAYKKHPYRWPTIGLIPEHIEKAQLKDVQKFYKKYYLPNNAILSISGNIEIEKAFESAEKWFGDIEAGEVITKTWEAEEPQTEFQQIIKEANVPLKSIYLNFHMGDRSSFDFYVCDVISDILSGGRSSRFYQRLLKDQELFSYIDAYITGTVDPGLFLIEAKPQDQIDTSEAIDAIWNELEILKSEPLSEEELEKVKNKIESALVFSEVNNLNKAINLGYYEMIGDISLINKQSDLYRSVTAADIQRVASNMFIKSNCTELIYLPKV